MVNGVSVLGDVHLTRIVVERAEILHGINEQAAHSHNSTFKCLLVVIVYKLCDFMSDIARVLSVPIHEMMMVVEV